MVPATALSIAIFLLLVAPGTCYELLRQRTRPPRGESTFIEISRILLSGMLLTTLTLVLLSVVKSLAPLALLDVPELLTSGTKYVANNVLLTGWSVAVELVAAVLLAVMLNDLITPKSALPLVNIDAWHVVAEMLRQPGQDVGVSVRLKDGTEVIGYYVGASTEAEPGKRELILGGPIHMRPPAAQSATALDNAWQRIVLSGSEISYISAAYIGSEAGPTDKPQFTLGTAWVWLRQNGLTWRVALYLLVALFVTVLLVGQFRRVDFNDLWLVLLHSVLF